MNKNLNTYKENVLLGWPDVVSCHSCLCDLTIGKRASLQSLWDRLKDARAGYFCIELESRLLSFLYNDIPSPRFGCLAGLRYWGDLLHYQARLFLTLADGIETDLVEGTRINIESDLVGDTLYLHFYGNVDRLHNFVKTNFIMQEEFPLSEPYPDFDIDDGRPSRSLSRKISKGLRIRYFE